MRRAYHTFVTPDVLRSTTPNRRPLRNRLTLLWRYTRLFWWLPEFWCRTVLFLLVGDLDRRTERGTRRMPALPVADRVARIVASELSTHLPNNHEVGARLEITNASTASLSAAGPHGVLIGYRWHDADGDIVFQGPPTALPKVLAPADTLICYVQLLTPERPGHYELHFALAQENVGWFDDHKPEFTCNVAIEIERYGWDDQVTNVGLPKSQGLPLGRE